MRFTARRTAEYQEFSDGPIIEVERKHKTDGTLSTYVTVTIRPVAAKYPKRKVAEPITFTVLLQNLKCLLDRVS